MKKHIMSSSLKVLLILFWSLTIILPLVTMFCTMDSSDFVNIVTSDSFTNSLKNSLSTSFVTTLVSVSLALILAMSVVRSRMKLKGLFNTVLTLPMLIPSISHGMGLIILFGSNGVVRDYLPESFSIYGSLGVVVGSVMYSFPIAYLMIVDILKYEDGSPYEAALVLGLSKWSTFKAVTLPYIIKPLINVIFAVFTMTITDYGVALMVGGKCTTLSVLMYREVVGMLNFGKGSVIGTILLIPALVACVVDLTTRSSKSQSVRKSYNVRESKLRDALSYLVCGAVSVIVLLPIVVFILMSFVRKYPIDMTTSLDNVMTALDMNVIEYLINSLVIALGVSLVGTFVATTCAYVTSRMSSKSTKLIHLLSISTLAVPGIVLGLSYVMTFKSTPLYGTFAILVLVNSMHFFSSPYLMMYSTFDKLNPNLEAVGSTLGVSRLSVVLNVLIPMSKETIIEMMTYFFVNSMMTISAVSFLYTTSTKPAALTITQFEGQMQLECAAFVSLLILVVNLVTKGFAYIIKRKGRVK